MKYKDILLNSEFSLIPKVLKSKEINLVTLPILSFDKIQTALKIESNGFSKIEYTLEEVNELIIFKFIETDQVFGFDISELNQNRIYFRHQSGKGIVFEVSDIKSESDFLQHLQ